MIIGVTGKSNSGKNTACKILEALGLTVWDLDKEAAKVREKYKDKVIDIFKTDNPGKIAKQAFSDYNKLHALEKIIFPVLMQKIENHKGNLVINGALLHRSGFDSLCSFIIYIDSDFEERLKRGIKRDNISEQQFLDRERMQQDVDYRNVKYRCPVNVVNNNGNIKDLENDIRIIINSSLPV